MNFFRYALACSVLLNLPTLAAGKATKVVINADHVLEINEKKVFHIGFDLPPLPDAKAWNGKNGIAELRDAGATFIQTGPGGKEKWTDADVLEREQKWFDAAAKNGMYCWPRLKYVPKIGDAGGEAQFRSVINRFKNHPAMGVWNSVDEPEWGKHPVEPLLHAYQIIHELDPDHPVSINHAPRGTMESLRRYNVACDLTGADIYPIGFPMGLHGGGVFTNLEISVAGDVTRYFVTMAEGRKPVWMYLQIAWSGVLNPGKTLRFPSFPEQRFMTYQCIINGARGIIYFGGQIPKAMTAEDAALGWNWTFWRRVLRPVVEEIGEKSPLYPALVAPESKLPVRVRVLPASRRQIEESNSTVSPADETSAVRSVQFCAREVGKDIFILACKREGATIQVEFSGLPANEVSGEVLFESPRTMQIKDGKFTDWFGPFEVHVYRFKRN